MKTDYIFELEMKVPITNITWNTRATNSCSPKASVSPDSTPNTSTPWWPG